MRATARFARSADSVALVTGTAAPDGIGAACARALAAAGCLVGLLDVADCAEVVAEIRATGGGAIGLQADLREEESIEAALAELTQAVGPCSILVNNAADLTRGTLATRTGKATADQPQELFDAVRAGQAIKRTLVPEDYAGVLRFLVSDQGGVITGQTISADAGLVFR